MNYLKRVDEQGRLQRAAVENVAPWARSAIVCAINYNTAAPYSTAEDDRSRGWISRYAWGGAEGAADYHDHVLERLRRVEIALLAAAAERGVEMRSWCYVDTGPIVERVLAKYAGIGWLGKNTLVINQELGSWLFLGVILTSLELAPDIPASDRCGTCTACLDACPTDALVAPYEMDARRCISYLTIEKRGSIPEELRSGMGRHLFGCDICQDVCPWNREAPVTAAPQFQPRAELVNPPLERIAEMSADEFRATFRGSPITRAKYAGLRRNAVVAMGNSGEAKFLPLLEVLAADPDAVLAEHARWAIERIKAVEEVVR
jgi:epoxyqueuosine reductase